MPLEPAMPKQRDIAGELIRTDLFNAWEYVGDGLARAALRYLELEAIENHVRELTRGITPSYLRDYKTQLRRLGNKLESNRAMAGAGKRAGLGHHSANRTALGDEVKTRGNDFEYHLCYLLRKGGGWEAVVEFVREHLWRPDFEKFTRRRNRRLDRGRGASAVAAATAPKSAKKPDENPKEGPRPTP